MKPQSRFISLLLATTTALVAASSVQAADEVKLRFEHFLPSSSNAQVHVIEPWCADLAEASDNRIKCEIYPSMQLGGTPAQLNDKVRNGVIDIAWTALGYSAGSFPRAELLDLPFMLPYDGIQASRIIWDYANSYAEDDFSDYKLLAIYSDVGGVLHTTKKDVQSVADMTIMCGNSLSLYVSSTG